jgi:hypothetical protein
LQEGLSEHIVAVFIQKSLEILEYVENVECSLMDGLLWQVGVNQTQVELEIGLL